MKKANIFALAAVLIFAVACATSYKAQPLPFRSPESYANAIHVAGAMVAAQAYADPKKAEESFGFDVRGVGFLPVQVIFDNQGTHPLRINPAQSFLEDDQGNLWPVLSDQTAYERATKYSQTKQVFKGGAYGGFLGAAAGAVIGAAIGIVAGQGIGESIGKGAALGGAAGASIGGVQGFSSSEDARRRIIGDLNQKSLENKDVPPKGLAYGFIFFPGEAQSAKQLRLQVTEVDTGKVHVLTFKL